MPRDEPTRSEQVYEELRLAILRGQFRPTEALKPQELANRFGVSLAVLRETLLRLVGEGLAERIRNRGFAVPHVDDRRWRDIAEARATIEPNTLRLAIERGDLRWEAQVRAAHHELFRTPALDATGALCEEWSAVHHRFHRALLEGCGNAVLLESFERLWTAGELARRWSLNADPTRDYLGEHAALEQAALDRDADRAAELLTRHVLHTVAALPTTPGR